MHCPSKSIRVLFLSILPFGVFGCSSDDDKQPSLTGMALEIAKSKLKKGKVEKAQRTSTKPGVTRAQLVALGRPVVFVSIPRFGSAVPAVELAKNGPFKTYMGTDQATVTTRKGIVTGTRGLVVDLFAQEMSISPSQLFNGSMPKTYTKSQRHLTGESTLSTFDYACAIAPHEKGETIVIFGKSHSVRQYTELCKNDKRAFQNSYWVGNGSGIVLQSHQSVSKEVGHIVLQRVVN